MAGMSYTILSHTADTGIEARAPDLPGLIEELATGMFALVATADGVDADRSVELSVRAETDEDLVVDVLSELLYRSEVDDIVFTGFEVTRTADDEVRVTASGVAPAAAEAAGPPIKAVTYHGLVVDETSDGLMGRVYFDV